METLSDAQRAQLETVTGLGEKLVWAIYKGTPEAVEHLIEQGAIVDCIDPDNMSALYKTGRDGMSEVLEVLVKHGANMEHDGDRGSTALYVASQNGHTKCVEVLLRYGAYLEAKFTGYYTPIYIAAQKGFKEIVEMLINHGADLETPCPNGSTALFVASQNGHSAVVHLLLERGANPEILFKSKTTPLEQAASRSHIECVQMLLQHGAEFDSKPDVEKTEEKAKKFVYCRKVLNLNRGGVKCILSHQNMLYISYVNDKTVIAYDTLSDTILTSFEGHQDEITCMTIHEETLYTGSLDKSVMVWDKNTGELLETIKGHIDAISCILYHTYVEKDKQNFEASKKILYTGSVDKTVRGWEGNTRKIKFEGHKGPITCMIAVNSKIYTMNYGVLYTGSADGTIRGHDIISGYCLIEFVGHEGAIFCLSEHDGFLYSGSADNTIKCWDRMRGKCEHTFEGHTDSVRCLQVLDKVLYSGSADRTIKAWGCSTKQYLGSHEGHTATVMCSSINKETLFTGSMDETIKFWELRDEVHYIVGEKYYSVESKEEVLTVAITSDLLFTGTKSEVRSWNIINGELIKVVPFKSEAVTCMNICEPANRFYTCGTSQIIAIWNLDDGTFLGKIPTLSPIICITSSLDDRELYTGLADGTARAWKPEQEERTKSPFVTFSGHSAKINCVLVHNDLLFTGSDDLTIRSWNRKTGDPVAQFYGKDCVTALTFDGTYLFGGCQFSILGWNITTGKPLEHTFQGHSGKVLCLAVQGNWLFSGSSDRTLRKWNKETGEIVYVFRGNHGPISSIAMNEVLLFSGSDRVATCWTHQDDKLLWATHYGVTDIVRECLEEGANLSTKDPLDRTLLMIACGEGHFRLVEYLLGEGAPFDYKNSKDQTALYFVLKNEHWNLLSDLRPILKNLKIIPGTMTDSLLRERVVKKDRAFFRQLKRNGVEFDSGYVVGYAASLGQIEIIKFFMEEFKLDINTLDREGKTVIQNATEHSRTDLVSFLNSVNANVPEAKHSLLGTLLQDQNREFQHLVETVAQMQKMFISVQNSVNTILNNQNNIQQLLIRHESIHGITEESNSKQAQQLLDPNRGE